jgi:hypothetical protein
MISNALSRALKAAVGERWRDTGEARALLAEQNREAIEVRYRLRTGALEAAAADLDISPATLQAVLDAHGLLLHDLPATEENS